MGQIIISTSRGSKALPQENIIRIQASSNYCKIFLINEPPLVVAKVLHWFQDNLPADIFYRIHRTHIINRMYVDEIMESNVVKLTTGDMLQISRRRKNNACLLLKQSA